MHPFAGVVLTESGATNVSNVSCSGLSRGGSLCHDPARCSLRRASPLEPSPIPGQRVMQHLPVTPGSRVRAPSTPAPLWDLLARVSEALCWPRCVYRVGASGSAPARACHLILALPLEMLTNSREALSPEFSNLRVAALGRPRAAVLVSWIFELLGSFGLLMRLQS